MQINHLRRQGVVAFKIPPTSYGKNYNLSDWKEMIWEGQLLVTSQNNRLYIQLQNLDVQNTEFGVCPLPNTNYEQALQKTADSSRGFALRLENKGRFAWIGIAFRDRNDAFDFNCAIQDFYQQLNGSKKPQVEQTVNVDYSIQKNQKIKLNFNLDKKDDDDFFGTNQTNQQSMNNQQNMFQDFKGFEQFGNTQNQNSQKQQNFANFNDFGFSQPQNQNQNSFGNQQKQSNFGDFDFSNFGNNQQNKTQQQNNNFGNFDSFQTNKQQKESQEENLIDL